MAFKIKQSGVTLKKVLRERTSVRDPSKVVPVYESVVYSQGDIVQDGDIAPIHIEEYDNSNGNIRELIERVEQKKTTAAKRSTTRKKSTKKQD